MISLSAVTKTFSEQNNTSVLQNVSLKINKGEFVYVVGDSGAGKTTLLKMLYGEEVPNQGSVEVLGANLSKLGDSGLQALRRRIGIIFQDLRLIEDLSAYDNVALSLQTADFDRVGPQRAWKRLIEESLGVVGAWNFARKKVSALSGGERQRVAAARAIVRQPELLIADEPTGSLDREHTWSLMDLFQKMHLRGATVLIATHDREIVRRVRRRSCVLKGGKLMIEDGVCIF